MVTAQKSIVMIIPWFGRWPAWMRYFVASCRANPTIDWLIPTDCGPLPDLPANMTLVPTSLADYRTLIGRRLGITCRWQDAYKLCDLKPALGFIHADAIGGYDFWGFGDLDVVYGDIRHHYTEAVLAADIISTHRQTCSGHLMLVCNKDRLTRSFMRVRGWRDLLSRIDHVGFDEMHWANQFLPTVGKSWKQRLKIRLRSPRLQVDSRFVEQFSTNLPPLPWIDGTRNYPQAWIWRNGTLTADNGGGRTFLYAHFSNWQSGRWLREGEAAWKDLNRLDFCPPGRLDAFTISARGFHPLAAGAEGAEAVSAAE